MIVATVVEWLAFFGRFHPLIVHLPIGILVLIFFFEVLNKFRKEQISVYVVSISLLLTAISSSIACLMGYFLSLEGGYNESILEEHQWQGIGLAIICWILWGIQSQKVTPKFISLTKLYFPLFILSFILMIVTGHHGGNLTHGESYLTENTPAPFRSLIGLPEKEIKDGEKTIKITNINEAVVYQDIVKPIFKQKCEPCHNANKMKGDLRMDEVDFLLKGGKHGVIFKANNVDESEFIKRIILPESDEEHMPPKGKNQIVNRELEILKWWIQQGASFDKKVSQLTMSEEIKSILAEISGGLSKIDTSNQVKQDRFVVEEGILKQNIGEVGQVEIDKIKKSGGLILPLSKNNNYVELTFLNNPKFSDKNSDLISIAPAQTLWLKISNTLISDKSCVEIAKLRNLTRLHLENTKITDIALQSISTLHNLEYLNLTNTSITDKGLVFLLPLKNLKKIYLWKTKVTETGVESLKKSFPNLSIEVGINRQQMEALAKIKAEDKSDDVYKK